MRICLCVAAMTRIVFIKLLIVVLAAFIICLPEFFTSDQALSLESSCFLFHPCLGNTGQGANTSQTLQVRDVGGGLPGGCVDISVCVGTADRTHSSIKCFLCETKMNPNSLQRSTAQSEEAHQQFFCCSNCTAQQENRTAQQENRTAQQEHRTAQQENTTHAATRLNHHCCILHSPGTNPAGCKTSPLGTHTSGAHWWSGRLTWLVLILAVILLVLGSVVYEVQRGTNGRRKKAAVLPISANQPPQSPGRHLSGRTPAELMDEVYFNGYRCRYKRSTLSPICEHVAGPELPVQENHVNSDSASVSRPANQPSPTGRN